MQSLRTVVLAFLAVALTACGVAATAAPSVPTTPTRPTAVSMAAAPSATVPTKRVVLDDTSGAARDSVLVSLHQSGGIAGINETLTVYVDGRIEFVDRSGQVHTAQISDTDIQALRALLDSPELSQARTQYEASGADLRFYEITLHSRGKQLTITTMDAARHPQIISQLLKELKGLRPTSP